MAERRRSNDSVEARRTTGSNEVLDRLFVYATLREGQTARALIANQIARCVPASATGAMYAFPMGYAGLVEAEPASRVVGEVVWLTELPATFGLLDAYEGEDFVRVIKQVELATGEPVWTWIYVLSDPDTAKHGTRIEHGDWARHVREQDGRR
jgi:gamma-glutamylcyclotransferase (GGCT)/AIG2-like uncharacterized protein YtfP